MPKYILVAVDGTGSHEWYNGGNSYTRKFFEQFNTHGGFKIYMHGPDNRVHKLTGELLGQDAKQRINDAKIFIDESIRGINLENGNIENGIPQVLGGSVVGLIPQAIGRYDVSDIEFVLVGHSRGGAIVIELARSLPKKALFMGLYDAVDMSYWVDASEIQNVKTVYHAKRKANSWRSWNLVRGDAGRVRDKSVEEYNEVRFQTSHGGVNGSYDFSPTATDASCSIYTPPKTQLGSNPGLHNRMGIDYFSTDQWKAIQNEKVKQNQKEVENCIQDSMSADSFIRSGAMYSGLAFDGTELQSIMFDKSDGHIRKR